LDVAKQVGGLLLVLILIFVVLRPTMKKMMEAPMVMHAPAGAMGGAVAAGGVEGGVASPELNSSGEPIKLPGKGKYEDTLDAARQLVNEDPKRVAQVVRSWVAEDGG
jgi:flagellar M-ring protein FliF